MSVDIDASGRKSTVRTCPQLLNFSMSVEVFASYSSWWWLDFKKKAP